MSSQKNYDHKGRTSRQGTIEAKKEWVQARDAVVLKAERQLGTVIQEKGSDFASSCKVSL